MKLLLLFLTITPILSFKSLFKKHNNFILKSHNNDNKIPKILNIDFENLVNNMDKEALKNFNGTIPRAPQIEEEIEEDSFEGYLQRHFNVLKNHENKIDFEMKRLDCWSPDYHRKSLLKIIEHEGAQNLNELINNNKSKITINLRNNLLFGKNITNETIKTLKHDLKDLKKRIISTFEKYDLIIMPTTPQNSFNISNKVPENQANFTSLANIADLPSLCLPFYSKNKQPSSLQLISSNMNDEFLIKTSSFFEKILQ